MKEYYQILSGSLPFFGFSDEELESVLSSIGAEAIHYHKGAIILSQGDIISRCGLILRGSISAESVSYSGVRRIISTLGAGELFGDVLASSDNHPTPVSVIAREDTLVLFLSASELSNKAENPLCIKVLLNMLQNVADKFWTLNRKIAYLSCKTLRGRISMFLLDTQKALGTKTFQVDYSREELASLLSVNRSALSRELSRMQQEGIISFYKSSFKIEDLQKLKECL